MPAFILRRLYRKGSLQNLDDGWGFTINNTLGSGYAYQMLPIKLNNVAVQLESTYYTVDDSPDSKFAFSEVSKQQVFALKMGRAIIINVVGELLVQGEHTVEMGFVVPGFGEMKFSFSDII